MPAWFMHTGPQLQFGHYEEWVLSTTLRPSGDNNGTSILSDIRWTYNILGRGRTGNHDPKTWSAMEPYKVSLGLAWKRAGDRVLACAIKANGRYEIRTADPFGDRRLVRLIIANQRWQLIQLRKYLVRTNKINDSIWWAIETSLFGNLSALITDEMRAPTGYILIGSRINFVDQ